MEMTVLIVKQFVNSIICESNSLIVSAGPSCDLGEQPSPLDRLVNRFQVFNPFPSICASHLCLNLTIHRHGVDPKIWLDRQVGHHTQASLYK
jgi:hypothetical protein